MEEIYEVFALKYADRAGRTRADSFIEDDDHAGPHPMDYFIWVIRNDTRLIVVDTGYDPVEGARRGRPILADPVACLEAFGVDAARVDTVIVTHLHYDHAGTLDRFPAAQFHLQAAEMAYATGPCMCDPTHQMPYTLDHVSQMLRHIYSGRVIFHDGTSEVAPGVEVHCVGGHSRGLQVVRVKTARGWLVLASDASHYYENYLRRAPFPIVADLAPMIAGFDTIQRLASGPDMIIPGHDPLVTTHYPVVAGTSPVTIHRLDVPPAPALGAALDTFRKG